MTRVSKNAWWVVSLAMLGCSPAIHITSIVPNTGPVFGETVVTISGERLTGVRSVTIGGQELIGVSVSGDGSITGTTPQGAAGPQDVMVATDQGVATLRGGFTYVAVPPPEIASIVPSSGPDFGGTLVTIAGSPLTGLSVSDTIITGTTPPGATGAQEVVVVTEHHGFGSMGRGFTYLPQFPIQ